MAAILSTATVSPCFAILVSREALPFRFVPKEEKTSFCARPLSVIRPIADSIDLHGPDSRGNFALVALLISDVPSDRGSPGPERCRGCRS